MATNRNLRDIDTGRKHYSRKTGNAMYTLLFKEHVKHKSSVLMNLGCVWETNQRQLLGLWEIKFYPSTFKALLIHPYCFAVDQSKNNLIRLYFTIWHIWYYWKGMSRGIASHNSHCNARVSRNSHEFFSILYVLAKFWLWNTRTSMSQTFVLLCMYRSFIKESAHKLDCITFHLR